MRHLLAFLLFSCATQAANSDPVYKAMREAGIQETFPVENLVIRREGGVLTLKSGTLGLTAPQLGRDTVAVFSGDGEFAFTPAAGVEATYLKSITGKESVQERFDRALFCFTDDTGKELRGKSKPGGDAKLDEILRDYRKRLRHRSDTIRSILEAELNSDFMDNIEAEMLADLYNPSQPGFFSAYLHGRGHGDLRFHVKPRGALPSLPSPEEVALLNLDPGGDTDGIWYLSHLAAEMEKGTASSAENKRAVQADSYKIETAIASNDHFTASTELGFTAAGADRVIKFALKPTLRVGSVLSGGKDVDFIQEDRKEDGTLYVILPENLKPGSRGLLRIEYTGDKVVHKEGGGNFSVEARESWYPNVNTFRDHAVYDLTFRVPKRYTLVSVGNLEKAWTEKDAACTHWTSPIPMAIAGFNYGDFKKKLINDDTLQFGLEGYATTTVPDYLAASGEESLMSPSRLMDQALGESQNAMRIYSAWFGKSEFTRIAITQQPQFSFGQSWPTLVYLPMAAFLDSTQRWKLFGIQNKLTSFVDEVAAHEVSHQWWGHMVGWETYHDQWLSEGFADFSAGLYLAFVEKNQKKYLTYWEDARKRLLEKNQYGRRANDAGPVWMGLRLESMRNQDGYDAVVYNKGAYVLHMLRYMMVSQQTGDKAFIDMLHEFVQQHLNRNATTESFKAVAEKYMTPNMDMEGNHRLDWFFRQWVYGTTVPRYKFEPTLTAAADGKWLLKASLTQSEVDPDFFALVPVYADFDRGTMRLGMVRVKGNSTIDTIQVLLPSKPKRVMINANHDILEQ
jgi:hypothetical protein